MNIRRAKIQGAVLLLLLGCFPFGCRTSDDAEGGVLRLIDALDPAHILSSPLLDSEENPAGRGTVFPSNSTLLKDLGSGLDTLSLKRKVKVGGTERNVLLAPPRSEYAMNVRTFEDSVLAFGVGIVREGGAEANGPKAGGEARGVNFRVVLEMNGMRKTLYQRYVEPPPPGETAALSFHRERLELPGASKPGRLLFLTQGESTFWSFWYNPAVYRTSAEGRRRVVLISIDTLRADHLGCYGYGRETSPAMDALASEGALFSRTYALSPWTLPSHVSLLTGLFGVHHQIEKDSQRMDPQLITLAEVLREAGFFTGAVTGGGFVSSLYGFSKGFDSYSEGAGGVFRQDASERVYALAAEWLDRHRDQDFFLFVHTYQPHSPYASPPPYKTMFLDEDARWSHLDIMGYLGGKPGIFRPLSDSERRNIIGLYDGEIRYTDERLVGPLISKLREMGLYDETLIILVGDHGEEFYEHRGWGHGHSLYEESLRVPLIVKFPGGKYAGARVESVVSLVDVMPTVIEAFRLGGPEESLDGLSLLPLLEDNREGDRMFLAALADNVLNSHIPMKRAVNMGAKKMIFNRRFSRGDLAFFTTPPVEAPPIEMYSLLEDPGETTNVAADNKVLIQSLKRIIDEAYDRAVVRTSHQVEIDSRVREQLKALGYIR